MRPRTTDCAPRGPATSEASKLDVQGHVTVRGNRNVEDPKGMSLMQTSDELLPPVLISSGSRSAMFQVGAKARDLLDMYQGRGE
jgi:hypothetical protein